MARHLQNIFAKLGVSSRSAATAFAFEHGLAWSSCPAVVKIHHGRRRQVGWFRR